MKTRIQIHFLMTVITAGFALIPTGLLTAGTFTSLHTFTATEGSGPNGLVLRGNTLYGTTKHGSNFSIVGTVFAVKTNGTGFTNLYSFTGSSQYGPGFFLNGVLILSSNTLFGTSQYGGTNGRGTIFAINTEAPDFTPVHNFTGDPNDGAYPLAGLILSGNTLYGTSSGGGISDAGTVFAINTDGAGLTNLHSFAQYNPYPFNNDGTEPSANLILSSNTLYGTALHGGTFGVGTIFAVNTDGSGFTNLHIFTSLSNGSYGTNYDGAYPFEGLILSGTTLYGEANSGGNSGQGILFSVQTDGSGFTVLKNFSGGNEEGYPSGLVLSGNTLYGTTYGSGSRNTSENGTVFKVNTGSVSPTFIISVAAMMERFLGLH